MAVNGFPSKYANSYTLNFEQEKVWEIYAKEKKPVIYQIRLSCNVEEKLWHLIIYHAGFVCPGNTASDDVYCPLTEVPLVPDDIRKDWEEEDEDDVF